MAHPVTVSFPDLEARRRELDTIIEPLRVRVRAGDMSCRNQLTQALVSRMFLDWLASPTQFNRVEHPRVCMECCEYYFDAYCTCTKRGVPKRNIRVLGSASGGGLLADAAVPTRMPRLIQKTIATAHARRLLDPDL